MKNKIFLIIILIVLFVFGILLYDFSDELDVMLTGHKWYLDENGSISILTLKNNKFSYVREDGNKIEDYATCTTYQFNNNVSMLKLKCDGTSKKLYISNYDDSKLVLNIDSEEKTFYSSKEMALIEEFKEENDLTDNEYKSLLSVNFKDDLFINYDRFNSLYKGKESVYIGLITNNINYENVYNYQALNNLINNSSKSFYLINIDTLNENEISKINKLTKVDNYKDKIYIYEVKNKKIKCKVIIDINNKNDLINYQNI